MNVNLIPSEPYLVRETPRWVVIFKPAGWLSIPGRSQGPVLSEWAKNGYGPLWVIHRLDQDTSGVILFAKTAPDHQQANLWFQNRQVKKLYHCLATGIPLSPFLKISDPIEGSPSTTQIEIKECYEEGFLAKVFPRTGRRHQIRIHLAAKGHPIWGDTFYGGSSVVLFKSGSLKVPRVALHASSLELPTGEKFETDFPEDMNSWVNFLRERGKRV